MANAAAIPIHPTYVGFLQTTYDAIILVEAALQGRLSHIPRRPHDRERPELIKSGNIFTYEEGSSGIKRWTDGSSWSPSRILANFLIYRELDAPFPPGEKKRAIKKAQKKPGDPTTPDQYGYSSNPPYRNPPTPPFRALPSSVKLSDSEIERNLYGSLVDSYNFKQDGLMKKTFSCKLNGIWHHVVSYYKPEDVIAERFMRPSLDPTLANVFPRPAMFFEQNYRANLEEEEIPQAHKNYFYSSATRWQLVPGYAPNPMTQPASFMRPTDRGTMSQLESNTMFMPSSSTPNYSGWVDHAGGYSGPESSFDQPASYSGQSTIGTTQSGMHSFAAPATTLPSSSYDNTLASPSSYVSPSTESSFASQSQYPSHSAEPSFTNQPHYTPHPVYSSHSSLGSQAPYSHQLGYVAPATYGSSPSHHHAPNSFGYGNPGASYNVSQSTPRYMSSQEHNNLSRRHSTFTSEPSVSADYHDFALSSTLGGRAMSTSMVKEETDQLAPMDMSTDDGQS